MGKDNRKFTGCKKLWGHICSKIENRRAERREVEERERQIFDFIRTQLQQDGSTLGRLAQRYPAYIRVDMLWKAVRQNGMALKHFAQSWKSYDLCYEAVKRNGMALRYVPEYLLDHRIRFQALAGDYRVLQFIDPQYVSCRGSIFGQRKIFNYAQFAVCRDARALRFVKCIHHIDEYTLERALENNAEMIRFVPWDIILSNWEMVWSILSHHSIDTIEKIPLFKRQNLSLHNDILLFNILRKIVIKHTSVVDKTVLPTDFLNDPIFWKGALRYYCHNFYRILYNTYKDFPENRMTLEQVEYCWTTPFRNTRWTIAECIAMYYQFGHLGSKFPLIYKMNYSVIWIGDEQYIYNIDTLEITAATNPDQLLEIMQ